MKSKTTTTPPMDEPLLLELLEILKFYHAECAFEYNLLGQRLSWFAIVQSFLITAVAVALGYKIQGMNWFAQIILPTIGIVTSIFVMWGVTGACNTIDMWMCKRRELLHQHQETLKYFIIIRDGHKNLTDDKIHITSYYFAKYLPWITLLMWIAISILTFAVPFKFV
jgi:hypothetical protein